MGDVMRLIEEASTRNFNSNFLPRDALQMTRIHPPLSEYTVATPWMQILQPNDVIMVQVPPAGSASNAICIEDSDEEQEEDVEKEEKRSRSQTDEQEDDGKESHKRHRTRSLPKPQELVYDSPIKLFATTQDISARRIDPGQSHLRHVMTLREMMGLDPSPQGGNTVPTKMEWVVVCNYGMDFGYLLHELPELLSIPTKLFFYGFGDPKPWQLIDDNAEFRRLNQTEDPTKPGLPTANPLKYKFFNGTHHTKMFLIGFEDRLRVIVHTANLLEEDLTLQTNGAFIQDFFLKSKGKSDSSDTTKIPDFEQTLISYMNTYGYSQTRRWSTQRDEPEMTLLKQLSLFNFSSAKAVLIPSSPGYYKLVHDECHHQGYLKVKRSIEKYVGSNSKSALSAYGPVVCQFSSIGAISEKWLREFVGSLSVPVAKKHRPLGNLVDAVKLVWPTGKEIQSSVQGIGGGGSVPGRLKNLSKPFLNPLYCKWSCNTSNPIFKGRNVPHIKTYYQLNSDDSFAWFMLGSHNLSKAAWGEVINGRYGQCLRVNSWELGVFMCPNLLANETESVVLSPVGVDSNPRTAATIPIPLPYNCRPKHYQSVDAPWHVGILE